MLGTLCISIDVELAWGVWDVPTSEYFRLCARKERYIVRRLLKLFDRYEVAATWAVVGSLLDRRTPPVSSEEGERIWYAPDVVEAIARATPTHDIGSHTFGHIYCGQASRESVREDLEAARAVHAAHGIGFSSFVFPRNQVSHVDLLQTFGLRVFRGVDKGWHSTVRRNSGSTAGRIANLADQLIPLSPTSVRPRSRDGAVVELPGSMLLLGRSGLRRMVCPNIAEAKARLGLWSALRTGRIFHLWFHPSNFYYDTDTQFRVLESVLNAAARLRAEGRLRVETMSAIADQFCPCAADMQSVARCPSKEQANG